VGFTSESWAAPVEGIGAVKAAPTPASATDAIHGRPNARRAYRFVNIALALSDAVSFGLALTLAHILLGEQLGSSMKFDMILLAAPAAWVFVYSMFGLYRAAHLSANEEFRRVISASAVGIVVVILAGYWSSTAIPRSFVGTVLVLALLLELAGRRFWRVTIAHLKTTGTLSMRTVVVGTNQDAIDLSSQLRSAGSGFDVVGHVAVSSTKVQPPNLPVVGGIARLAEQLRADAIECVFVASSEVHRAEMPRILQAARQAGVDVRVSANLPELLTHRVAVQAVGNRIALSLKPAQLSGSQAFLKRAFDVAVACTGLLMTSPLWIAAAIAVKLSSPGPVFFRQVRVTQHGREFNMMKFRTMRTDVTVDEDESTAFFKPADDPRITKIGAILRRLSIDELPQLFNVLSGDMSIVGPRPLPTEQVNANAALLTGRLEVPAGMTGWWQIRGRSDVDATTAVGLDTFYIENWSLSLDLYIVLKTFGAVIARVGAR
jgi:exopolysaccharide biosynthesis polyprenyl glycosylphosphotransferase